MVRGIAERAIGQSVMTTEEGATDRELLAQFLDAEGPASQDAFRELMARHGSRVLGICRHVLDREHDAEDAFQATFLALARNGASIRDRCALGGWLQEVAYRTALKTRARRSRRRTIEKEAMVQYPPRDEPDDQGERAALAELRPVLQEEVTGLPDKYRLPVVLSYLEGKTNEEVAALLQWPVGTVKGRLSRGRALLRSRLTRRGVALSATMLLWALSRTRASAAEVPARLLRRTLRVAAPTGFPPPPEPSTAPSPRPEPEDVSSGDPAASVTRDVEDPPRRAGKRPSRSRFDRLATAAALILAFSASVMLGGFVSAATYGGRFPDFRVALGRFNPLSWRSDRVHCQDSASDAPTSADGRVNRIATDPGDPVGSRPRRKGR